MDMDREGIEAATDELGWADTDELEQVSQGAEAGGESDRRLECDTDVEWDDEEGAKGLCRRVLFVDDEVHILKAVKRLFLGRDYDVVVAEDGHRALEIVEAKEVAVVVSDQRMPGMSGAELLSQLRQSYPHITRIMLTGNNDVNTAMEAINTGQVFRFITKPWDHDAFLDIIEQGVEQYHLRVSKKRYEAHIERQNERLQVLNRQLEDLNEGLEARVRQRTAALRQQKAEVARLYRELQDSFDGMLKALLSVMELGEIHIVEHCQRTAERVRLFSRHLGWEEDRVKEVERAALLHWIGLINASPSLFQKSVEEFDAVEEATWDFHPLLGQQAICHVPALQKTGSLILYYMQRHDDPAFREGEELTDGVDETLSAEFIEECQVLGICSAFEQARTGRRFGPRGIDQGEVLEEGLAILSEHRGGRFDPMLVDEFVEFINGEMSQGSGEQREIELQELRPGMVLARPLETRQGIPVAPRDMIVTEELIERLQRFHDSNGLSTICIWG